MFYEIDEGNIRIMRAETMSEHSHDWSLARGSMLGASHDDLNYIPMSAMTQILPESLAYTDDMSQTEVADEMTAMTRQLTAVRAEEQTILNKLEWLFAKEKSEAYKTLQEALRRCEDIVGAQARTKVQLEIAHENIKTVSTVTASDSAKRESADDQVTCGRPTFASTLRFGRASDCGRR